MQNTARSSGPDSRNCSRTISLLKEHYTKTGQVTALGKVAELDDPFRVLIATVLSQRTRDEVTSRAERALFGKFQDAESISQAGIGEIENLTSEEITGSLGFDMTNILSERVDKVPGAETVEHLRSRVRMTETYLQSKYSGKRVLGVSHGGFIRMFFRELVSDPHNIRFTNCSYFTVYIDSGKISLMELSAKQV